MWPELQDALAVGMPPGSPLPSTFDRPDIVARCFAGRLHVLLHLITKLHILGRCVALHWSKEWQKRGGFFCFF